ncbi:hypothetical protein E1301_Tti003907 [Triplophysa tibetana]|uniref:DUF4585 domain-containing protein n=1 Tax=Triplophysa tibetana TaxID=1572043 RepID=A0A5A9NJS5_9TELE|nr:hypothetical protein E1301_Tti003907 [Triplophysa tibetana]
MDPWVLDGDSYSFFHSAPRTFNLQNLDAPNRVEIFDITAIPSHRSAISETTCLCDIFGDDLESPLLSSNPSSTTFLRKETEQTEQTLPADDANDSSGSYHTACGSDSGDTSEVAYATPSPENIKDVSIFDTNSSPIDSTIFSDSKIGPFHCTPPPTCVNCDDLSHAENWEEPQVSVSIGVVNETEKMNESEPQYLNSATSLNASENESLEDREPSFNEREVNTTPEHTNTSPILDNVVSHENTEGMYNHNLQHEDFLSQPMASNSRIPSELYKTPPMEHNCSPIAQMSTSPPNRDINSTPELKVISSPSPVSREISCTPLSAGTSSPAPLNLGSGQEENKLEFQDLKDTCRTTSLSTLCTDDNMEIDFPSMSTETRESVCSTGARETPASSEISDICSFPDVHSPARSPELVIIHSSMGYTISPSPTNDRMVYSTEPEASAPPSSEIDHHEIFSAPAHSPKPVIIPSPQSHTNNPSTTSEREVYYASPSPHEIDRHEICSALAYSPEPVIILSSQSYTNNLSTTSEREVYSTEPEATPSPHEIDRHEFCLAPAHSPEPVIVHSTQSYTNNRSPTSKREVYSTEPEALPSPHEIDRHEFCLAPGHSPEPVIVHSTQSYTNNRSPTSKREVYSTEPEATPSPHEIDRHEFCLAPGHSPEPVIVHSTQSYTNNRSPTSKREVYSTEPEASLSPHETDRHEICSAPAHSPEPVIILSPQSYTNNPSPTSEREVYSTEPEALPSPHEIDHHEICSTPAHSPEPVIIHSPQSYTNNPYPTSEREVYSTEPEAYSSSPVITGIDYSHFCSSPDHSILDHSPEPETNHLTMDYTISPSPTNERKLFSVECDDLPPSPAITRTDYVLTPAHSQGSTPELRSITSTPNSRQNYLTPEPTSPAPSLQRRSVTYSPEMRTMSYSFLPQNKNSPTIQGFASSSVSLAEILAPEVEKTVCGNCSEMSNSLFGVDAPVSRNVLSTPGSISRPSTNASDHNRYTALSPDLQPSALESSTSLEQMEDQPSPIICERMNPSLCPMESRHCDDLAHTETFEQTTTVLHECRNATPHALSQMPILQDPHTSAITAVRIEKVQKVEIDDTDLNTESVEIKQRHLDVKRETEMLKDDTATTNMKFSQLPVALSESPQVICKDNVGEYDRQPCREKEESGKRGGEGVDTMGEGRYRGEQVELSFSARNRKGPAAHSLALSSRDPKSGIPARCYFESHPTAPQQQSQLRAQGSQQENKSGARRLQSSVQGKFSSAGFLPPECLVETSSMGSEFDEADNEVKWFTDLAFTSLSSPPVDYLDVYNSSHRSSTNVSQPSTNVDSPGAVAWMNYADLRGSTLHDHNDLLHSSSYVPHDGLDPAKSFETGSFECVDVALETKEESSRKKRTVPKRQIQLLRRNTDESKPTRNTENVLDSLSTPRLAKDTFVRQHSTPVFIQKKMSREEPASPQIDLKRAMQKSLSLDDASPKTQMASCVIKSVLSKKMQDAQKEPLGDLSPTGYKNRRPGISPSSFDGVPSSTEKCSLSSSQHSESTFSSEDFAFKEEKSPQPQRKKCAPKVPPKPTFRPAFMHTGGVELTREETRPKLLYPFKDKAFDKPNGKNDKKEGRGDNYRDTSGAVGTQTVTMQRRMTSRDTERHTTQENRRQHGGKSVFMSKTPEITLKPSTIKDKKKSSLKVSLSPDIERSREMCEYQSMEKSAEDMGVDVTNTKDNDKTKSVIHKVRDVRKLVKNTYNLSFKPSTSAAEDAPIQEKREKPPQAQALQIECKAISWKDKQTDSKAIHRQGETQAVDISKISQPLLAAEISRDIDVTEIKSKASLPMIRSKDSQCTTFGGLNEPDKITERSSGHCNMSAMQAIPPRPPSKDREVSALMVLQDGTSKIQNTFESTIADSNHIKATSSSHSVSMLLKEKGMQADFGVCGVISVGASATAKHVNRLEVPLQACLSEAQASSRLGNAALDNNSSKTSHCQNSPQLESAEVTLAKESPLQSRKGQDKTEISATTTMTQIATNLTSCKPVLRSISTNIKNNATPTTGSKEIELPIQVRSISSDRLKPFVPPKPSYTHSLAETKSSDPPKPDTQTICVVQRQTKLSNELKKNDVNKDQLNEVSSNKTKKLAVSAVSSNKPPPIPVTTTPNTVQKSTRFASVDQPQSSAFLQATSTSQQMTTSFIQDHSILASSFASSPSDKHTGPQTHSQTQPVTRSSSNNRFHTEDYRFYASDDPPSYDERESFSPVRVSDLPQQRGYRPSTKQSACSCTQTSQPQGRTPPASPSQSLSCPGAPPQAQVRPHQSRPDGQALNYSPVSTNSSAPHASALVQPLHHPRACHVPNIQSYSDDQLPASGPRSERRPNRSPQVVGPASYHEYAHSANMPQLFNPQELPPSFGHDYGHEGPGGASVLYPENASGISCGQAPRRVLLDPDTGKYFYVEVPMQPLRKMLFDPELGQYVEVLIPQQAMSHSGLYPPAAPPYSSLHNPGLYAPQYLPYAVPSYQAIPSGAQQVRHPEAPHIPTTLHQTSLRYGSPASQIPRNDPKAHSSLDQSYLESMYYIPTGINASPNSNPSDCYHKPSSNLPPGGRRV